MELKAVMRPFSAHWPIDMCVYAYVAIGCSCWKFIFFILLCILYLESGTTLIMFYWMPSTRIFMTIHTSF